MRCEHSDIFYICYKININLEIKTTVGLMFINNKVIFIELMNEF